MSDEGNEERSVERRVIDPRAGTVIFELGKAWPQPPPHAALVLATYGYEISLDPETPIPKKFKENRAEWRAELKKRMEEMEPQVAGLVEKGEPLPTWAIVDYITTTEDMIVIVGRPVGRWKNEDPKKQKSPSVEVPRKDFAVEMLHYGDGALQAYLEEIEEEEDEPETETESGDTVRAPESKPVPADTRPDTDACSTCGSPLAPDMKFCGRCGASR